MYNASYEVCSLAFLLVIIVHFIARKRFPNLQNAFFTAFLVCVGLCVGADIASAYTLAHISELPLWLNHALSGIYYFMQFTAGGVFCLYTQCLSRRLSRLPVRLMLLSALPVAAMAVMISLNPVYGFFFRFEDGAYLHGPLFPYLFGAAGAYMLISAVFAVRYRLNMPSHQYATLLAIILLNTAAFAVQLTYPQYLITGVALSLSVLLIYLGMQNPDELLDELTGAFNRACFLRYMRETRERGRHLSMVVIALDRTRAYNNMFGMSVVDELLTLTAHYLKERLRAVRVFRIVGDQFALVCPNAASAARSADIVAEYFSKPVRVRDAYVPVHACLLTFHSLGDWENEPLIPIEYMVAEAKRRGAGTRMQVDDEVLERMRHMFDVESMLRASLERGDMEPYYQPIYSVEDGRFREAEALMRLQDAAISPSEFIPIAEKSKLLASLGMQTFEKSCLFARRHPNSRIHVNLSAFELVQPGYAKRALEVMERTRVSGSSIVFELTESVATEVADVAEAFMRDMSEKGCLFALDDFGTGYANVDIVMRLPFSIIKFDRSMLLSSYRDEKSRLVFEANVELMKRLGMRVIVEGVETVTQANFVRSLGADAVQGFFYARPMPAKQAERLLT